jgi:beta-glucosidase-like glycosyl hydrolase/CubicO group peptidase (beta-lactamase class C family)
MMRDKIDNYLFFILLLFGPFWGFTQSQGHPLAADNPSLQARWVDSVYNSLTVSERLGQLFMVQAFSNGNKSEQEDIENLIKNEAIGGLIFSKGGPGRQAVLTNQYQSISEVPLLIGMDAEWGLSMRLDSTYAFPWNMTLGAIKNNDLITKTGRHIGDHCRRLGVHFNFAPVVDINTNPNNPIIGNRSFGESRSEVTVKSLAFMKGMQSANVLASAKHFPGHGDTEDDSHETLPSISFSKRRIDSIELYPYKKLIKEGLSSVMVAHLNVPSLISQKNLPSSLSEEVVSELLKVQLEFKGLIFTDALTMKGAANYGNTGTIDLMAFLAGNDVLLMSQDVKAGKAKLQQALENGEISEERLAHSVKKILMAKYKVGLHQYQPIKTSNLQEDINRIEDDLLKGQLFENAITVVKNDKSILPLRNLETKKIAYVKLGDANGSPFLSELQKYAKVHVIQGENLSDLQLKLQNYNTVIISFHKSDDNPWKPYKLAQKDILTINAIASSHEVILDLFVKPYALSQLELINNIESVVVSYQNDAISQAKSAQLIFGAIGAKGQLPVSAGDFKQGTGVTYNALNNLSYGLPESVGMDSKRLLKLDSLANYAIDEEMTPGLQLLVARKGKVIYNKSFGYHTYDKVIKVADDHLYDIASLTKILATLPLLMELEEKKIITLNSKLGDIIPYYKDSNKAQISLKQMLSHYARLKPWVPFYYATLDSISNKPNDKYYQTSKSREFNIEVTDKLFLRRDYSDSINKIIKETDLLDRLRYRYSDLPYYILKQYIENYYDQSLSRLVQQHFYEPLGANNTTYNPRERFSLTKIVPTEVDTYFRYQKVHGYVHDMGAAMQNGVGGHAGVFSNANDVAKLMQMYLQKGFYGGRRYLKTDTIDKFNKCYYCYKDNRRGVGFDKPQLEEEGPTCGCVSKLSFGHTGFTGTMAWADPEEEIVYVFLSNRTYPEAGKNRLLRENIRTEMQRLIYEAIIDDFGQTDTNFASAK